MGRIVVDLPDEAIRQLDNLKAIRNTPRAEIIRQAISHYLADYPVMEHEVAFGLWRDNAVDGVAYQEQLREEWE